MNTPASTNLYAVDPGSERFRRWVEWAISEIVNFYRVVFLVWAHVALGLLAVAGIIAGICELTLPTHRWYLALPSIAYGVAFFASLRFRRFAWTTFGFGLIWFVIATVGLAPFVKIGQPMESPVLLVAVGAWYVLPPLIAAAFATRSERRKS